jgi:DNA mismatch repair protein MSH2
MEYQEATVAYSRTQSGLVKEVVSIACLYFPFFTPSSYRSFCSYVYSSAGVTEWRLGTSRCDFEVGLHISWSTLRELKLRSFAHVAVNAPEAYVKPTVIEKGSYLIVCRLSSCRGIFPFRNRRPCPQRCATPLPRGSR